MARPSGGKRSAPKPLSPEQFPARLKREGLPAVLVLAGTDGWLRARSLDVAVRAALPEGDPGGALVRLDGRVPEQRERVAGALDELRSASLFAPDKVVIVENPEAAPLPGRAATVTQLAKGALASPAPGALLILSTSQPVKGRGCVSAKALADAGAWLVDCRSLYDAPAPWERGLAPYDHELSRFVAMHMKRAYKKKLSLGDAHAITRRAGNHLGQLDDALRSLALFVGEREAVTAEDIEQSVGRTREDPVWKLVDAVLDADLDGALDLITASFERGVTDQRGAVTSRPEALFAIVTASLHGAWRRLLGGAEGLARGESGEEIAKVQGIPPFLATRFAERCRRSPARILALHQAFLRAETGVKGGGVPARLACERLVASLVAGLAARPPNRSARA